MSSGAAGRFIGDRWLESVFLQRRVIQTIGSSATEQVRGRRVATQREKPANRFPPIVSACYGAR